MKDSLWKNFHIAQKKYKSIPKWIWNTPLDNINAAEIYEQMKNFRDRDGYSGLMIVLWGHDKYLSEEYFIKYGEALNIAAELDMKIILWDENGFPSGYAGGIFEAQFPDYTAKRLDMTETAVTGPMLFETDVPYENLMGVVVMNKSSQERFDITSSADIGGHLQYAVPAGDWKIMIFGCVKEEPFALPGGNYRFIDYLDSEAAEKFIQLTHQKYYERFSQHFGTTIKYAFYDEPSFWRMKGRIWTTGYNKKFEKKYGYGPQIYYPALWYDIGEETDAARNILFGFRAELYANEYVKTLGDWCRKHGIELTGHMDQEEILNPVPLSGDLMKVFEHQDIPGVDEIFEYGRGSKAYKIVSSAAFNYDKPTVMCEVYGAMGEDIPINILYKEVMDLYAKGINFIVPHGTWYDNVNNVIFPPELSYRSAKFGPEMSKLNDYISRLSSMLQGGRHVADIGILYPIAALQAGYRFGEGDAYLGGKTAEEANYMELGEMLSLDIRRDFTYIHPEVFDKKCTVRGAVLDSDNTVNNEHYKVIIISGSKVIHLSNLKKIKEFYDNGGKVIAVGLLPYKSAEFGYDDDVKTIIKDIFDVGQNSFHHNKNSAGGRSYYIKNIDTDLIKFALDDFPDLCDVEFADKINVTGGNLSYIHKIKEDKNIYFIANSGDASVNTVIKLRGKLIPEIWDPHDGEKRIPKYQHIKIASSDVTIIELNIPAVKSLFIINDI